MDKLRQPLARKFIPYCRLKATGLYFLTVPMPVFLVWACDGAQYVKISCKASNYSPGFQVQTLALAIFNASIIKRLP